MKATCQTRVAAYAEGNRAAGDAALSAYADLYGRVQRSLFADMAAGESAASLKGAYLQRFGIPARMFNAVRVSLEGKVRSVRESRKLRVDDLRCRIARTRKQFAKASQEGRLHQAHHKRRRLADLEHRLKVLRTEIKAARVRLCFGSRRLWRRQHHLEANGYASHEEWLQDWRTARGSEFFVLGSRDETAGCQLCVAAVAADGSLTLRLRLPGSLAKRHGKYVTLSGVRFAYGQSQVLAALGSNADYAAFRRQRGEKLARATGLGQAISYRFKRDGKGWRVFVTTDMQAVPLVTDKRRGAVGVHLHADHLAVCEADASGNYVHAFRVPLVTYGKSGHQAAALIGDAVARAVKYARHVRKPIVTERLNFRWKKAALEGESRKYGRMLSSLWCARTLACFLSRGHREGVGVHQLNPALGSVIGRVKFMQRYGLGVHQAAALVLARRLLRCSEGIPRRRVAPVGNGVHVAFHVPARKRVKHVWTYWRAISEQLKPALAARHRQGKSRDGPHPTQASARSISRRQCLAADRFGVPGCESRAQPS